MLLTDTIQRSTSAIQAKKSAIENKQSQENYAKALTKLSQVSKDIKTTIDNATSIYESGIVTNPLMTEELKESLLENINDCGNGIYDGTLSMDMVKVLQSKGSEFSSQIALVWKDAAEKYASGPKGYLAMIAGLTENPKHSRELVENINATINSNVSAFSIRNLIANVDEAKTLTDAFSLNASIECFLKKVSAQQATVMDLTPEILAWLKEKHLTTKLKIRF